MAKRVFASVRRSKEIVTPPAPPRARQAQAVRTVLGVRTGNVQHDLDRFLALVVRELGAREAVMRDSASESERAGGAPFSGGYGGGGEAADVRPVPDFGRHHDGGIRPFEGAGSASAGIEGAGTEGSGTELRCVMADGRRLVVTFDAAPSDRDAKQRRLEMLARTFGEIAEDTSAKPRSRPPVARSLKEELAALCLRSGAHNALIVDANSPVIWGAANVEGLGTDWPIAGLDEERPADDTEVRNDVTAADSTSRSAVEVVRGLAELNALRKGRHLRHLQREGAAPFLAHSFAGIYLVVLVFDAPFDELRAERAVVDSLPRIEQLVLALPPLDPSPTAGAGVVAIRRGRPR